MHNINFFTRTFASTVLIFLTCTQKAVSRGRPMFISTCTFTPLSQIIYFNYLRIQQQKTVAF